MSQSDATRTSPTGQLASTPPAEVLKQLEGKGATARVHFETEIGRGEVDVVEGKVVDALLGDLFGRQALLSLLGASEGSYTIGDLVGEPRPPICESVEQLLADRTRRITEWRHLSEQMPPLSSSLRLSPEGEAQLGKAELSAGAQRLRPLLDGRRTIADLVDQSGLDAVDAFGILLGWLRAGHILELPGPEMRRNEPFQPARPTPRPHPASEPAAGPATPMTPMTPMAAGASPSKGPRRRTTVIGMGIPAPEPVRPRRAEVHRMIAVGTSSAPPPVEVGRVRTVSAMPAPPPTASMSPTGGAPIAEASPSGYATTADGTIDRTRPSARRAVGRYEVLGRIGHGGMGSVYLCRMTSETGFRRLFALKLLRQHLLDDAAAAGPFLEEARLAGLLHHPNVVSVVDAGIDGVQPYLVMDYVEGASLKQLLAAHPIGRPAELIVPIILDGLAGLHAAHNLVGDDGLPLNIVHCDVSPENLLVGVDGICRLTDFGVARRESTVGERLAHGKPGYLAPEQILRRPIDRRADIFSMGIVLYNTLTGVRLFDAGSVEETLQRVVGEPIPPPSTVGLGPPPCFDFICMKALERDPSRRYSSAEDMASELRRMALRENLLAPTGAIAAWVRTCVGQELDQRRLLILDASRTRFSLPPEAPRGHVDETTGQPGRVSMRPPSVVPQAPLDPGAPGAEGTTEEGDGEVTGTIPLDFGKQARRWVLIAAAVLAAAAVISTLLWPARISKLFSINTAGVRSNGVDITLESALAPAASGSNGAPASSAPAIESAPVAPLRIRLR